MAHQLDKLSQALTQEQDDREAGDLILRLKSEKQQHRLRLVIEHSSAAGPPKRFQDQQIDHHTNSRNAKESFKSQLMTTLLLVNQAILEADIHLTHARKVAALAMKEADQFQES